MPSVGYNLKYKGRVIWKITFTSMNISLSHK
jgi:hypothetical protein